MDFFVVFNSMVSSFHLLQVFTHFAGLRPVLDEEMSKFLHDHVFMGHADNSAEEQFRFVNQERREICQLRNEYVKAMTPVWDSFCRNIKIRVDLAVDSDGKVMLDDDGRTTDLSGNDHFESKSMYF